MTGESIFIKQHKQIIEGVIHKGTATAGGVNTLTDDNIPDSNITDIWNDEILYIFAGTGAGQSKKIQTYDQPTHTFTLYENWIVQPDTTSRYQVVVGTGISGGAAGGDATAANQAIIIADVGTVDGKVDAVNTDQTAIIDALYDAAGIATYPAAAPPGDGVSLAEVLRQVFDDVSAISGYDATAADQAIIIADVGTVDGKVDAVNTDLGDFSAQVNLQSLLAVMGGGWDAANNDVYTALITDRLDNADHGLVSIYNRVPSVSDVVLYPVAIHAGTAEITDDGSSPAHYADTESGTGTAAAPRVHWVEYISHFEREGTINAISMFFELRWQCKRTAGGENAYTKIQVTGDGGSTWVDVTDDTLENDAAYQAKTRIGVGLFLPTITAGASKLGFRMISWSATGASTIAAQIRSDSYMRLTYRKS